MMTIKTDKEIAIMRVAGKKLAHVVSELSKKIVPGVSGAFLDREAEKLIGEQGARVAFRGYGGEQGPPFPAVLCFSRNDEVVHGIPREENVVLEGDILSIDIGLIFEGFYADMARTYAIGTVSAEAQKIISVTKECLERGIATLRHGATLEEYEKAVQDFAEGQNFSVVRNLVGHGIGRDLHEDPQIPNYVGKRKSGVIFVKGMTVALEPMITAGSYETTLDSDGWTFRTKDGSLSAHFEDTVLITKQGSEILTRL